MEYMIARIEQESLHGIRISQTLIVSFRFFPDNLGQFIPLTQEFIEKSVIIPFSNAPLPEWVGKTSYRILKPKEVHKYLGTPLGHDIDSRQLHIFVIERVKAHILHSWSTKTLSFSGRILLIRHILQAIPIYHLLFMPISTSMSKLVASILKDFLWGFNEVGGRKTPLVA